MMHASLIAKNFQDRLVFSHIHQDQIDAPQGVVLIGEGAKIIDGCIFVTQLEQFKVLIQEDIFPENSTVFVSCADFDLKVYPEKCNIFAVNRSLEFIHNKLYLHLRNWNNFYNEAIAIPAEPQNAVKLLQTAIKHMGFNGFFYVLSPAFQVVCSVSSADALSDVPNQKFKDGYYLTHVQIEKCIESLNADSPDDKSIQHNRVAYRTYPIHGEGLLGYLMIYGVPSDFGYKDLVAFLTKRLADFLTPISNEERAYYHDFSQILEDVLISPDMNIDRLRKRLTDTPDKLDLYIRNVVVEYDQDNTSTYGLANELKSFFKTNNCATYDGRIIVWLSSETHIAPMDFDGEEFDALLKKYSARAIVSNPGRFLRGIRTLYLQCVESLPLLPSLDFVLKGRSWVFFEEISIYHMIQLCESSLEKHYGHERLVYLVAPRIMGIIRYDMSHGTNLLEFLFYYLESGRNINNAAKVLHMHRNTVMYKLKKTEEILGVSLSNQATLRSIEMSCRIIMYSRYVAHEAYSVGLDQVEPSSK